MIDIAKKASLSGSPIDVQALFSRMTMDNAGEFLFGTSDFNTLDLPLPIPGKAKLGPKGTATDGAFGTFAVAFEDAQMHVIKRASATDMLWMAKEFFKDGSSKDREVMDAYLLPLAQKALDANKARLEGKAGVEEVSFLDHLAASVDGEHIL